jgi:hypothetical protein
MIERADQQHRGEPMPIQNVTLGGSGFFGLGFSSASCSRPA